VLVR
jgi:Protein of unknown function (DUF732)